ncbi:MAG TPA: glycosyltransferase [archaeon]|nr:glycosyltransferase [archaeon]
MHISVVIAALNEEKYIGKTLQTLNAQKSSHEFEVIVGDGFSTDKTAQISKKLGAKVVKEKRHSAAFERNAGAKIAKGDIIAFTDADAQIPSDWVENIAKEFEASKDVGFVYGPVYFSDTSEFEKILSKFSMDPYMWFCALIGFHNPIGSNIAIRRGLFEKLKGFDTSLVTAEDLDLAKRASQFGKIVFSGKMQAFVSARRVKKWGYLYYIAFHLWNALRFHLTGRSTRSYAPVR